MSYRPSILIFGDSSPPEFTSACGWLRSHGDVVEAERLDDGRLTRRIADGWHPELIVGLQDRPGQWREDDVQALSRRWPLAVLVTLLGSWCEGEPRTGRPLPGVARVLWHQWEAAFGLFWDDASESPSLEESGGRDVERFDDRGAAFEPPATIPPRPHAWRQQWSHPWRQPRIRSVNEAWLDPLPPMTDRLPPGCLIAIDAAEPAGFDMLADVCREAGALVSRFRPESPGEVRGAAIVLWDEPGWSRLDGERLAACVLAAASTPVVALFGILRWQDWRHAESLGVAVSLAKPFQLAHLIWHLNRILRVPAGGNLRARNSAERAAAALHG